MADKPKKLSKLVEDTEQGITPEYQTDLDKDVEKIVNYLDNFPRMFVQSAQPTIDGDTFAFWKDTDDNKYYLLKDFAGVTKASEIATKVNFVDRGNVTANDFVVGDFTTDGNWHDLDLSSIITVGAVYVSMRITITDDASNSQFYLRENGNANAFNATVLYTQVANIANSFDVWVAPDSSGVVEYWATNTTWSAINLTVRGWFI